MSLDVDVSRVQLPEDKLWEPAHVYFGTEPPELEEGQEEAKYMSAITTAVAFATMPTGINYITEDNYVEFYVRYKMVQGLMGQRPFLTLKNVKDHIGLRTNASYFKARQTWMRELLSNVIDNTLREDRYRLKHLCTVCDNTADAPAHWSEYKDHKAYHVFAPAPVPESTVPTS